MIILAYYLSGLALLMSLLLLVQTKSPTGWLVLMPKLASGALSPIWAVLGAVGAVLGWGYQALWAVPMGMIGTGMMILYVWRCTREHNGFEKAFGAGWSDTIPPEQTKKMAQKRWGLYLKMKTSPQPICERDIPFGMIPGTDRQLLCDIWRPADGQVSGLAFIYYHGSGWTALDKDVGTRFFFRHLVAQGHVVMDVAYRLCPEVDIYGMIGDVKRAIAWMKDNALRYGVIPEKVVLGGASAGGHLAQLAGYTPGHPELTPDDLKSADLAVCGVVSYYGPADLLALYHHMNLHKMESLSPVPIGTKVDPKEAFNLICRLDILLGGWPHEVPHMYRSASPITHVRAGCPPTMLIQGKQDFITSVEATCALHTKLVEAGVPTINIVLPWTDHAFDILLPQMNPAAQSALYDVDRFLALLLHKD